MDLNLDEIDGKSALFHAAENNLRGVVKNLFRRGLDINITNDEGKTAVSYANENHSMDALCELINCDAEFSLNEIDGKAALFCTAKNNLQSAIWKLRLKGLDLNITDVMGKTAVFYANENHSMGALCALIACDAELNLNEIDGKAALFHAAEYDQPVVIWKLRLKGLDLNITDDMGKTAVFYAIENHSMGAFCELIECGAEFSLNEIDGKAALFFAAENDLQRPIRNIYCSGLDLNITDDMGKTAVFYANENHSMDALCELIDCDAEFNLNEINGKAALFNAAKNNLQWAIWRLHSQGLDLNITDDMGKTAVFYANKYHSIGAFCELIGCGAAFSLNEIDPQAVLFFAAKNGLSGVVKPLYSAGVDLNATDKDGKSVVFFGDKDFVDALITVDHENKDLINTRDLRGRTALFDAFQQNSTTRAQYLIKKGASLQFKDYCNVTIFSFFVENCIATDIKALQSCTSQLFQEEEQLRAVAVSILHLVCCQAPLLSIINSPGLLKPQAIFNKENVLKALTFAHKLYSSYDPRNVDNIIQITSMIRENKVDVPLMLSLFNNLGTDPSAGDSDGNTAAHYATLLPLFGVTQETVMHIFKQLRKFGALFNAQNHKHRSPLLFCLSSYTWKNLTRYNIWQSSIGGLVEVCRFLLRNGCFIYTNSLQNAESIFHRIISLIQYSLELNDDAKIKAVLQVLIEVLKLLPPEDHTINNAVNSTDTQLNSPLHLWASIALKSRRDYEQLMIGDHTFESILRIILDHLLKCGAKVNPRNANEETPLHMCRTWTAVKLLLDAGANPKDVDSSGHSPFYVAANRKNSPKQTEHLYPDVTEKPESFWRDALVRKFDPWIVDKQGESVLSVLIKSEAFGLAKSLIEVGCKENYVTDDAKVCFLNVICNDKSKHTHWKTILVEVILKSATSSRLSVESSLHSCCRNMVECGMTDEKLESTEEKQKDDPSDHDGQPVPKKRSKDESATKDKEKDESNNEQVSYESVHCKIAKQLLSYGADINIPDSSGMSCLDIANDCPPLLYLLKNSIDIDAVPIIIPWTSFSERYKSKLGKVARQRECKVINEVWYHSDCIASGSFGSIFAGINTKDGREVAIKRIEKLRMRTPQDRREIRNLTTLADCDQVVRYVSFFENEDFSYIVLELMEGSLEEYLNTSTIDATTATLLCRDLVMGLQFLHEERILHRDLKPQNILYKVYPKICLKLADFGLSHVINSVSTTSVYGTNVGSRCWMAPELLTSTNSVDRNRFEPASDVFSCGLLFYYILSGQYHPFWPKDCRNKSELQVSHETEANIMNGTITRNYSLCPEASHLIERMIGRNDLRPSAKETLEHPLFWANNKKVDFLKAVGNQEEFECPRSKRTGPLTQVEKDLENGFRHRGWMSTTYGSMHTIFKELTRKKGRKSYDTSSAVELVRFIRNAYEHFKDVPDKTLPIRQMLFTDFVFFKYFPDLVLEVYKAVTANGWDKARDDVKFALSKPVERKSCVPGIEPRGSKIVPPNPCMDSPEGRDWER